MTDAQMYFAIAVPVFAVIMGTILNLIIVVWQSRGIERRLDRVEHTLEVIQADLKQFYADIAKLKERSGL
jgi:hypothetical protein